MTEIRCCFCVTESTKSIKTFYPGNTVSLPCEPGSNRAKVQWSVNDRRIENSNMHQIQHNSLLILHASDSDTGQYTCTSVESSNGIDYVTQTLTYELRLGDFLGDPSIQPLVQEQKNTLLALKVMVIILTLMLLALVTWNFYKGHFEIPKCFSKAEERPQTMSGCRESLEKVGINKAASKECSSNSNNNHNRLTGWLNTGNQHNGDKVF